MTIAAGSGMPPQLVAEQGPSSSGNPSTFITIHSVKRAVSSPHRLLPCLHLVPDLGTHPHPRFQNSLLQETDRCVARWAGGDLQRCFSQSWESDPAPRQTEDHRAYRNDLLYMTI